MRKTVYILIAMAAMALTGCVSTKKRFIRGRNAYPRGVGAADGTLYDTYHAEGFDH